MTFMFCCLPCSQTEINDRVRKSVNLLLNRVLSSGLKSVPIPLCYSPIPRLREQVLNPDYRVLVPFPYRVLVQFLGTIVVPVNISFGKLVGRILEFWM